MSDRVDMLEATLNLIGEGVAILDEHSTVLFWNRAAADLTGYSADDILWRSCPKHLYRVDEEHRGRIAASAQKCGRSAQVQAAEGCTALPSANPRQPPFPETQSQGDPGGDDLPSPTLVSISNKLGHSVPGMLREATLRHPSGAKIGTALLFYPVEEADALPHGDCGEDVGVERSQAAMEDRLDAAHHQWATSRMPFGLLWITIDQAQSLRCTHGRDACEAMLRAVEQTLLRQMKPAEIIGRWGSNEFLVLAHERTASLLAERAQRLAGLARTADFRWWGDRVGLTVSIGATQAAEGDTLQTMLNRARQAMHASEYAGGNRVTEGKEA